MSIKDIPIEYIPDFIIDHNTIFNVLWKENDWLNVAGNRLESYHNDFQVPYTYGSGSGIRSYTPQPYHELILSIRRNLEKHTNIVFEVCFLNGYRNGKDQLGWHSDDSPEMDDNRPIAIISLGAEREIYFRKRPELLLGSEENPTEKLWLESGSLCLMKAGMQDTHQHRIPKSSIVDCGPRISLTFRGYKPI